ncbi:MAG TPA: hypothetical protein PLP17_13270 [Oligoflexia bacterium]|nr:hypothetical protein [Oligoflexia bacterium]
MKTRLAVWLCGFVMLFSSSQAQADYFVYDVICEPTQFEDVARVIRARIYLDIAADKTITNSNISVSIRKGPAVVEKKLEAELMDDYGYFFNTQDLSFSLGGTASGHACFRDASVTVSVQVTRKDGTTASNQFVTSIRVPGAYATKAKVRIREP